MNLVIPQDLAKKMQARFPESVIFGDKVWGDVTVDHLDLPALELTGLKEELAKFGKSTIELRRLVRKFASFDGLQPGAKIKDLELMADAIRQHVQQLPNGWIFIEDPTSSAADPYLVTSCKFQEAQYSGEDYIPAHVVVTSEGRRRGQSVRSNLRFEKPDLQGGITPPELLFNSGWLPETPQLVAAYEESCEKYEAMCKKFGTQYTASGTGMAADESRWSRGTVNLTDEGQSIRVILDDDAGWGDEDSSVSRRIGKGKKKHRKTVDPDEEPDIQLVRFPAHPYVRIFSLLTHEYVTTHVNNLEEYVYDRTLSDRLVLSESIKSLIDMLLGSARQVGDDIIKGKGKGIIILSSGPPGTGKTLTGEVYAEKAQRPLYTVQCSQLGVTAEDLEKELTLVLKRAQKWKAILLIDEADVYIRERGADINQNAVVGVFLRLLEYYKGVMFLTTNRATVVDDAIISRCIAHAKYQLPDPEERRKIWEIMGRQFHFDFQNEDNLVGLADRYVVSGRVIKQMVRLAVMAGDPKERGMDLLQLFEWVYSFQEVTA